MFEHLTLLSLTCNLAFYPAWLAVYERDAPTAGFRQMVGIVGWRLALAGYLPLSTMADYRENAPPVPLGRIALLSITSTTPG